VNPSIVPSLQIWWLSPYTFAWRTGSPLHSNVKEFLEWLDKVEPGWDANLQSTYEPPDVGGRA